MPSLQVPKLDRSRRTLVVLSQVYVPDPASVGQHFHDVTVEMAARGWEVIVFTSDRGYEDPSIQYPRYEKLDGVHVVRVPFASFGKGSIAARMAGGMVFLTEATLLALALPRIDRVLISTSPPMCALAGIALARLRRVPVTFWAMDINPDQIVVSGARQPGDPSVRMFETMMREMLTQAQQVVALDRFMAARLIAKRPIADKITIIPPWPHVDATQNAPEPEHNPFRREHGLLGKFVLMYSGNLSLSHPVTTILEAASRLQDERALVFLFVGGGLGRVEIERHVREHALSNVLTLPYQPLSALHNSLAAADVHLVAMGNEMVGIVHPCKVYGAMAIARPVLVLGPAQSHLGDLVLGNELGWQVQHGDIDGAVELLRRLLQTPRNELRARGERARAVIQGGYSKRALCGQLSDLLES